VDGTDFYNVHRSEITTIIYLPKNAFNIPGFGLFMVGKRGSTAGQCREVEEEH
jgi:hypothetical protein